MSGVPVDEPLGSDAPDAALSGDEADGFSEPPSARQQEQQQPDDEEPVDADDAALEAEAEAAYLASKGGALAHVGSDAEAGDVEDGSAAGRMAEADAGSSSDEEGGEPAGTAEEAADDAADSPAELADADFAIAGEEEYTSAGDPSSIHAPAGSGAAVNEAAAKLARVLAADSSAAGGGEPLSVRDASMPPARRHEMDVAMDTQAQRSGRSAQASQRGSQHASSRRAAGAAEEKQASDVPPASHRSAHAPSSKTSFRADPSVHGSARAAAAAAASLSASAAAAASAAHPGLSLDDDLAGLEDDLDDAGSEFDDEYESEYDLDADDGESGGGRGEEVRTLEDVMRAKEEREHLIQVNKIRQRQIALILEREKAGSAPGSVPKGSARGSMQSGADSRGASSDPAAGSSPEHLRAEYLRHLDSLNQLWDELESKRESAEDSIDKLTSKLDEADAHAAELADSFKAFKREVAKEARYARTGKSIKLKRILAFEAAEEDAEREVARVRLRHINLLNELRVLEESVRSKERLAEGLHLIDFEQLKIENQTLNEKIEERNDELHKLKKKTTSTVQVLTHLKEKMHCVKDENQQARAELQQVAEQLQHIRDTLTRTKHARDEARAENHTLKQKQGFIGSDSLVSDFEHRKGDIEVLRSEVESLKSRWRSLQQLTAKAAQVERTQARMDEQAQTMRAAHYATIKYGGATAMGGAPGRR